MRRQQFRRYSIDSGSLYAVLSVFIGGFLLHELVQGRCTYDCVVDRSHRVSLVLMARVCSQRGHGAVGRKSLLDWLGYDRQSLHAERGVSQDLRCGDGDVAERANRGHAWFDVEIDWVVLVNKRGIGLFQRDIALVF
ncbi:hypothetical protein WICPIJ_002238 [Wickerhamomyces pijperi]|uniref:Uncharacterized protein n=1 Tax=Wickerhamomyces pijperi TaxID=599730 RepID=A0A9P8QC56_WICPI|nr:hypothetical protein WICPIJ_002238 [Wickerhamomyces pijperi]